MKKIIIFTVDYHENLWGIAQHVRYLEKTLISRGFSVLVNVINFKTRFFFLRQVISAFLWQIISVFKFWNFDILNIQSGPGGVIFFPFFKKWKLVCTVHHTYYQQCKLARQWYKFPFVLLEILLYNYADKIVSVSESTRRVLTDIYYINSDKIAVISNTCIDSKKLFRTYRDPKTILFVWRLEDRKNPLFVLEFFKYFYQSHPDYSLHILWRWALEQDCFDFVKNNNLSSSVYFYGAAPDDIKFVLLASCQYLIIPSKFEGQGIVFLEWFVSWITIFCNDCEWLNDMCPENNRFHSVEELSHKVTQASNWQSFKINKSSLPLFSGKKYDDKLIKTFMHV